MFLIMGTMHLIASFVLFLFEPSSADMAIHFIGGLIEFVIGSVIFFVDDCIFRI